MKAKSEEIFLQLFTLKYKEFKEKNRGKYLDKIEIDLESWIKENYKKLNSDENISLNEMKKSILELIRRERPEIKTIEEAFVEIKMQNDFDNMFSEKLKKSLLEKELEINENIKKLYWDIYKDNKGNVLSIEEIEKKVVAYYKSAGFKVDDKIDVYFMK